MEGIYKIECDITGQTYIGSSIRIKERWKDHRSQLGRNVHHCKALQELWNLYGEENFSHEIIEETKFLEERETHWIQYYKDKNLCLNTSNQTSNPMRNPENIRKMLQTRGDKQRGTKSSSAKLHKEQYLQIFYLLATTTYSAEDISDHFDISPRAIRDIQNGDKHQWIQELFPEDFAIMQHWRKNLRVFRAQNKEAPQLDLPIDIDIESFRRTYTRKPTYLHLVNKEGEELKIPTLEEAEELGLKPSYLKQLKAGKLIRYKGWFIKK